MYLVLFLLLHVARAAATDADTNADFINTVKPFVRRTCAGCHNAKLASGEVDLAQYLTATPTTALKDRDRWELVVQKLRAGEMPPKGTSRPPADQISAVINWVETSYARIDRETPPNPGRVTAHRLNRYEYNNTIRDLLGIPLRASDDFPVDPYGYGFDNIGDVLSLSPVLTEKYLKAAEHIASIAIPDAQPLKPVMSRYLAERMGQARQLHIETLHEFPVDGEYTLRSAWFQGLRVGTKVEGRLFLDGKEISKHPLTVFTEMDRAFETAGVPITAGLHKIEADIRYDGTLKDPPFLEYLQVYGPNRQVPPQSTAVYKRIFVCADHTDACARRILEPLAHRAYRRPVAKEELDDLASLVRLSQTRGDSFDHGIRLALTAILVNPNFLFRIERDPPGAGPVHRLSDLELASRLSYFLWSSMPDDELLELADSGTLRKPDVLDAQVRRMLARSEAPRPWSRTSRGQWLQFRNLDAAQPDPRRFPEFDDDLRAGDAHARPSCSSRASSARTAASSTSSTADYTFLNERLAKHYGIAGRQGRSSAASNSTARHRGGVLTQASMLTVIVVSRRAPRP